MSDSLINSEVEEPKDQPADEPKDAPKDQPADEPKDAPKEEPKGDPEKDDGKSKEGDKDKETEKKSEGKDKKTEGAPEEYEDFKLPEGVEMDKDALEQFKPLAKELNLSQDQAQKLVDLKVKTDQETVEKLSQQQWDVWDKTQKEWAETSRNHPEFGGENFNENVAHAKKAIDAYGDQELKDILDATGAGNHVAFLKFAAKVGKEVSEDKLRTSGSMTKEASRAARIYDKTSQKS